MPSTEVRHNAEESRFEITVDDVVAGYAQYRQAPKQRRAFLHTEVDPEYRGQGLGGQLMKASLDTTREEGLEVLPYCPGFQRFITQNSAYLDLVPEERRSEFNLEAG